MSTHKSKIKGWIKLADWKKINFPIQCPYTGLKANSTKEYVVENSSFLWIVLGFLRLGQYITLHVPLHENGILHIKKARNRAILKGLGFGSVISVIALIIGVYIIVTTQDKTVEKMAMMLSGITFVFSLILGPI